MYCSKDWLKVANFETAVAFYGATVVFYSAPVTNYSASLTFYDSSKANFDSPVAFSCIIVFFEFKLQKMKKSSNSSNKGFTAVKLMIALTVLFFLALLLTIYFIKKPITEDTDGKIRIEVIKSLLTILSVAIIGGVVAALFKSYERYQEQLKLRLQAKTSFMTRLGELYRTVKRSRRKLNANGIEALELKFAIALNKTQITLYKEEMALINDVQLELEGFKAAVENEILFSYNRNIIGFLTQMESYLRKILKEFERNFQSSVSEEYVNLDNFPYLKEFTFTKADNNLLTEELKVEKQPDYCFKTNFSEAYYKILSNFS